MRSGFLGFLDLPQYLSRIKRASSSSCLPHNTITAAIIAAVLNLDTRTGASGGSWLLQEVPLIGDSVKSTAKLLHYHFGNHVFMYLNDNIGRQRGKFVCKKTCDTPGCHNKRRMRKSRRMAYGLPCFCLRLGGHGAGINNNSRSILGLYNRTAKLYKVGSHKIKLNTVYTAPQVEQSHSFGFFVCHTTFSISYVAVDASFLPRRRLLLCLCQTERPSFFGRQERQDPTVVQR